MPYRLSLWLAAAWWASLSTLGLMVVPLLFIYLPTPAIAGSMAAHLFSAQTWLSCACAASLLLLNRPMQRDLGLSVAPQVGIRIAVHAGLGLFCAMLAEWVIAPHILVREDLQFWHRLGSASYLLQWLFALAVFRLLLRRQTAGEAAQA